MTFEPNPHTEVNARRAKMPKHAGDPHGEHQPGHTTATFWEQLPLLLGLVLLWIVLWRNIAPITVITGFTMAIIVVRMFYLPPVRLSGRFSLWYSIVLACKTFWWLLGSNFRMAWIAIRPKPVPTASIIAVRMRNHSDWLISVCAEINMLVPGSVVVEVDRMRSILYLHVLDGDSDDKVRVARDQAFAIEDAVVLALGNRYDIAAINEWRRQHDRCPLLASAAQERFEARVEDERRRREAEWEASL